MLDAFEARIVELLRDRLSEVGALAAVHRPHDGLAEPAKNTVQLRVQILDAQPQPAVGDDEPMRLGERGAWRQRITLRLRGVVELRLSVGKASSKSEREAQRGLLMSVLDRLLVTLADEALRAGAAFAKASDQGFALDGFRFEGLTGPGSDTGPDPDPDPDPDPEAQARQFIVRISYAGLFWPVGEEQAGVSIAALPIRTAVLPAGLPRGRWVRAGEEIELTVEVALGGMVLGEGQPPPRRIMARLRGASPGQLLGGAVPEASGWIGYAPAPEPAPAQEITLRYQAPDAVSGKAEARIELALERPSGGRVGLGELVVEVRE